MRKFTLSVVALLASATCFAQTTLWNGEDKEIGTTGDVWDRCSPVVVETPDKDDVNGSDKCLKFTITGNEWDNGDIAFGIEGNEFASQRISLMMKKDKTSNVRVNLEFTDGSFKNVAAWYDGAGKWKKLYFDFSTNGISSSLKNICVYPNTEVTEPEEVYIDNIVIEDAPMVNGKALNDVNAADLTGNIKLTGAWIKGECQNTDNTNDWQKVEYNDFAALGDKLADKKVTSIDMRGTVTKDVDVNPLFQNPNTIVYADATYGHSNVVVAGNAASVELTDEYAFNAPYGFDADNVAVKRNIQAGVNSLVLPFELNAEDISAGKLATYTGSDVNSANFESADHVAANTPMLVFDMAAATELTFGKKYIVETPAGFDGEFKGVYVPQSATGLYGIDNEGRLHKGGESATIGAFRAYLQLPEGAEAPAAVALDGTATAIDGIAAGTTGNANAAVYDLSGRRLTGSNLQKGIYIIGGKKVAVK